MNIAVVGCGHIGRRHLAVIAADRRAALFGYFDSDAERMVEAANRYPDAKAYASFAELIADAAVDLVSICTPHGLHAPMAIAALNAGKHVLVEKPMALETRDAEEMIAVAKRRNRRLYVVKQNRFNTPIRLVKQAIDADKLGRVYLAQCNVLWNRNARYYEDSPWRGVVDLEGGVLQTQVSHFIDLLIWWLGDVERAAGMTDRLAQQIEFEDCGVAALKFASGALGSLTWTTLAYNANLEGSITLLGERGTIKVGGKYLNKIEHWDVQSYPMPDDAAFDDQVNDYGDYQGSSNNHDKMIDSLVDDLLERRHGLVEGAEALKTIEAIEAIYGATRPWV